MIIYTSHKESHRDCQTRLYPTIHDEHINHSRPDGEAKERLIEARDCHLNSLEIVLKHPRVQRAIEPMIVGTFHDTGTRELHKDLAFARDLGLIAPTNPVRIANPIYNEVIPSVLADQFAGLVPF